MHTGGGAKGRGVFILRGYSGAQERDRTTDDILLFNAQIYVTESSRRARIVIPVQGRQAGEFNETVYYKNTSWP